MDSSSQRTYVTDRLRNQLNIPSHGTKSLTDRATEAHDNSCDVVELGFVIRNKTLMFKAPVTP